MILRNCCRRPDGRRSLRHTLRDKENLDKQKRQKTRNAEQKGVAQKQGSLPRRFLTNNGGSGAERPG